MALNLVFINGQTAPSFLPNNTGTSPSNQSSVTFQQGSSAANSTIQNPVYSSTTFLYGSNPQNANISLTGGSVYFYGSGDNASIIATNPTIPGQTETIAFSGSAFAPSNAASAHIYLFTSAATLQFGAYSDGGNAYIYAGQGSLVDFSGSYGSGHNFRVNAGELHGAGTFNLGGDTLILGSGAISSITGNISGNVNSALVLNNNSNLTISGGGYTNVPSIQIDSSSGLTLGDGSTVGALGSNISIANDGTLTFNEPGLTTGTNISGSGHVQQKGPGTLALTGQVTNTLDIYSGTLELGSASAYNNGADQINFVNTGPGATARLQFDQPTTSATVNGMAVGDTIDVKGIGSAVDAKYLNNSLIFQDAAGNTLSSVQVTGDLRTDQFAFSQDGSGGAQATLQQIPHHVITDLGSAKDELVYLLYQAAFDRIPDEGGFRHYANLVDHNHLSLGKVAKQFVNSAEFKQDYGSPSNAQFVTELYNNVLGRSPDAGGLNLYVNELNNHSQTKAQVLTTFAESPENHNLTAPRTTGGLWVA